MQASDDVIISLGYSPLDEDGIKDLDNEIHRGKYALVIIDTFSRAVERADQNDMVEMTAIMGKLQRIAIENNMGILLVDHHKKPNGSERDPIDDLLGSTGKAAVLDTAIAMYRERGKGTIKLQALGRDIEPVEMELFFNQESLGWETQSEGAGSKNVPPEVRVLEAIHLLQSQSKLVTGSTVAELTGMNNGNTNRYLSALEDKGKIHRLPKIGVAVPYELVEDQG